jgi:nitrate/nitrite transporter NarK
LVEFALWSAINGLVMVGVGDLVAGQVVTEWVERGRGLALGLVYAGSNIGGWLVLNAAAAIATWASWREAYLYVGIAGVIVLLPFAGLAIRAPAPGEGAADAELDLDEGATEGLGAALRTRSFWLLAFGIAAFFAYFVGILDHLVPFLEGQGFSKQQAAWYYSVAVFLGFFSKPIFGLMADRIEARSALLLNTALFALSSLMLFGIPGPAFLWAFVLLYGISSTARDVVYPLIVVYCFGVRRMAAVYGAVMLGLLVGPLGSIGAAAIRDRTGSYHGAFFLFAALNVLSVVLLTAVRREIGREGRFLEEGLPEEG